MSLLTLFGPTLCGDKLRETCFHGLSVLLGAQQMGALVGQSTSSRGHLQAFPGLVFQVSHDLFQQLIKRDEPRLVHLHMRLEIRCGSIASNAAVLISSGMLVLFPAASRLFS